MSSKLAHTVEFEFPVSAYQQAMSSVDYWNALVASATAAPGEVTSVTADDTSGAVALIQRIPADKLPSAVTTVISGDLSINREMSWTLNGENGSGTFNANVSGAPATTTGTFSIASNATSTTVTFAGEVTVKVPFIGAKIEKLIAEQLIALLNSERDFLTSWHAQRQ